MVNWDALYNLSKPTFNTSGFENVETIVPTMIEATDTTTQGYFGLGIMIVMFLVMLVTLFKDDGDIRQDILRSIMISSGFTSIVGLVLIVTGFMSSFVHLMWFFSIFMISVLGVYLLKRKGQ
jgi:hypothetical protein